ncbi:MAG: beta-propeller domain-containing protein, partial [Oscillospiraceae bacterium]
ELMMNSDSLFITSTVQDEGFNTGITRFVLDKTDVKYVSSGMVPGTIDNQFSLDEYNGNLRIATTSYNREKQANVNNLYILDPKMKQLGAVENLAEGESIKSVRFMDDTAYVVTFRQTDPLFVIDLSDPKKPVVKGELKIPGFSEYLHPIDENTLVGIGYNTLTNRYGNVMTDGLKLSLFDVSDPTDPTETASLLLGNIGSESEALSNHRAVMWYPEMRLLGFPATLYTVRGTSADDPWSGDHTLAFAGYLVVRVNDDGFEVVGQLANDQSAQGFLRYDLDSSIERGLYIGKTLYTAAPGKLTAYSMDDFKQIGELVYPK